MIKKVLLWILGTAVTLVVIGGGIAAFALHNTTSKIHSMDSTLNKASDMKTSAGKPVSYLLLGTDTGALGRTEKGRTDTMMVMTVNPNTKTTTMVSKAMTNSKPVAPNVKLITLAGFVLGIFAGFAWLFIKEVTDRTVKDLEFLTDELKLTNLGVIAYIGKIRDVKDVIAANQKKNTINEMRTSRLGQRI